MCSACVYPVKVLASTLVKEKQPNPRHLFSLSVLKYQITVQIEENFIDPHREIALLIAQLKPADISVKSASVQSKKPNFKPVVFTEETPDFWYCSASHTQWWQKAESGRCRLLPQSSK